MPPPRLSWVVRPRNQSPRKASRTRIAVAVGGVGTRSRAEPGAAADTGRTLSYRETLSTQRPVRLSLVVRQQSRISCGWDRKPCRRWGKVVGALVVWRRAACLDSPRRTRRCSRHRPHEGFSWFKLQQRPVLLSLVVRRQHNGARTRGQCLTVDARGVMIWLRRAGRRRWRRWPNQALQQTGAACSLSGIRSSPSGPGC